MARFAAVAKIAVAAAGSLQPKPCRIASAGPADGGAVLIETHAEAEIQLTALGVAEGSEQTAAEQFIAGGRSNADVVGLFANREAALAKARTICPANSPAH